MSQSETLDEAARARAFQRCYAANATSLIRFIQSKVGNQQEAEDLAASVFIKALRGADWSRPDDALRHWLYQTARTTIIDHWRVVGRLKVVSLDTLMADGWEGPPAGEASVAPTTTAPPELLAAAALAALPPNYQAVLRCRFLDRLTIKETAQRLNLSEANVKVLQLRALKRAALLRADLSGRAEVPTDG